MLDKFYELKIREKRQYIGATGVSMGHISGGKYSIIGQNIAEPSYRVCGLITDILMFVKFKLIVLSKNQQINLNVLTLDEGERFELRGLLIMLKSCKSYIIRTFYRKDA